MKKKQKEQQKAMEEAKKLASQKGPLSKKNIFILFILFLSL